MNRLCSLILATMIFSSPVYADSSAHGQMSGHENGHGEIHADKGHLESAAGHPGRFIDINQTVQVSLYDNMRFSVENFKFKAGDTIRFIIVNDSQMVHEFAIGDKAEMREHALMMRNMPDMKHDEGNVISLAPGEVREMIWTFSNAGIFEAACNLPGHYDAGMKAVVEVV